MKKIFPFLLTCILLNSCSKEEEFVFYNTYDTSYLKNTTPITTDKIVLMEGIYSDNSDGGLGSQFVLKWNGRNLSLYSNHRGIYAVLDYGLSLQDTSILLAGYWRSILEPNYGTLYLKIKKNEGSIDILTKTGNPIRISGNIETNTGVERNIEWNFKRNFSTKVQNLSTYYLIAHRGGGRNSDFIPFSENSLSLLKHASSMGANGVEIDVKLTKDKIPIIYHDDDINTRLTKKSPAMGRIEDFNWKFLNGFVELVDGQKIPTLEEALDVLIDSTTLNFVWLDNKGGTEEFFKYTLPIMYKAVQKAKSKNRKILIINGIPTEEVAGEFSKISNHRERPSLCEISLQRSIELASEVYAPRWTLGTLESEVSTAHSRGMKVVTWTVDMESVMRKYLKESQFDGMLTNYAPILAYEFYSQE